MITPEFVFSLLQCLSTIVLVAVTIYYVTITHRTMELQIEPRLEVRFHGTPTETTLEITNASRTVLSSGRVEVDFGYINKDGTPYPWMTCVFAEEWGKLRPGKSLVFHPEAFLSQEWQDRMAREAPSNTETCMNSLHVRYSFVRRADLREFCFRQGVSCGKQSDGSPYFVSGLEPAEAIHSLRGVVARRKTAH